MTNTTTELQAYYDQLAKADWFYSYSDDHRVWRRGEDAMKTLKATAKKSPQHQALFNAFQKHYFSGKPWNTPRAPRPERPA